VVAHPVVSFILLTEDLAFIFITISRPISGAPLGSSPLLVLPCFSLSLCDNSFSVESLFFLNLFKPARAFSLFENIAASHVTSSLSAT